MADYDVIVLGTGAAGLTAAVTAAELGANVGLFEKGATIGGTTVYSGGMIWIPLNQHEPPEKGDTREQAMEYLRALSNDTISDEMAETYIDVGPEMVRWLDERTPVKFRAVPDFPDYHPEQRGGLAQGGRSLETAIFPYGELGEWGDRVHISPYYPSYHLTIGETTLGQAIPQELTAEEMQRRADNDERGMGLALGGRLLKACLDRGVEPQTSHRGVELIMEDGKVAGVVFETPEGRKEVRAPNVVIATGGFEHNADLKRAFLRGPCTHTVAVETNDRRRPEDGHARRRDARKHARGVVDADDRVADRHRPHRPAAADLRADAAGRDHGQPRGQAVHQRGRELQRVRGGVPRAGHDHGRLPQPAVLAGLRSDVAGQVRLRRRPRRNREGPDGLDHVL